MKSNVSAVKNDSLVTVGLPA